MLCVGVPSLSQSLTQYCVRVTWPFPIGGSCVGLCLVRGCSVHSHMRRCHRLSSKEGTELKKALSPLIEWSLYALSLLHMITLCIHTNALMT